MRGRSRDKHPFGPIGEEAGNADDFERIEYIPGHVLGQSYDGCLCDRGGCEDLLRLPLSWERARTEEVNIERKPGTYFGVDLSSAEKVPSPNRDARLTTRQGDGSVRPGKARTKKREETPSSGR